MIIDIGPNVSNMRISKANELVGIWQVGDDLLIAGHWSIENQLAHFFFGVAKCFTIADFTDLCRDQGFTIREQVYLADTKRIDRAENLFASTAVFILANK